MYILLFRKWIGYENQRGKVSWRDKLDVMSSVAICWVFACWLDVHVLYEVMQQMSF